MEPVCPSGQKFEFGACWSKCPPQMSPLSTDLSQCVVNAACPPTVTQQDVADASVCTKVVFPVSPSTQQCSSSSFTQWVPGQCLANCPPGFIDNGQSCLKRTIDRISSLPTCASTWRHFDGAMCRPSTWATLMWYVGLLALIALLSSAYYRWFVKPCPQ